MSDQSFEEKNYDSNKVFLNMIQTNTLKQLVQRHLEVQGEIKSLDHDIQSLVFENYSKFTVSIDTVKKMKEGIVKIDEKLKGLKSSSAKVNRLSLKIDSTLRVKRGEIQKLDTINKDLSGLKLVCEFPTTLKNDIAVYKGALAKVVKQQGFNASSPSSFPSSVLSTLNLNQLFESSSQAHLISYSKLFKFKDEKLLGAIYKEAIGYLTEIRSILWGLQNNMNLPSDALRNITKCLFILEDDKEKVIKNYLKLFRDRTLVLISQFLNDQREQVGAAPSQQSSLSTSQHDNAIKAEIEKSIEKFLGCCSGYDVSYSDLEETLSMISSEIIKGNQNPSEKGEVARGSVLWVVRNLSEAGVKNMVQEVNFMSSHLFPLLDRMQPDLLSKDMVLVLEEKMSSSIKEVFVLFLNKLGDKIYSNRHSSFVVNECLVVLHENLTQLIESLESKSLKEEVSDKFSEKIEQIIKGQVSSTLLELKSRFIDILMGASDTCDSFPPFESFDAPDLFEKMKGRVNQISEETLGSLYRSLAAALIHIKPFLDSQNNYLRGDTTLITLVTTKYVGVVNFLIALISIRFSTIATDFFQKHLDSLGTSSSGGIGASSTSSGLSYAGSQSKYKLGSSVSGATTANSVSLAVEKEFSEKLMKIKSKAHSSRFFILRDLLLGSLNNGILKKYFELPLTLFFKADSLQHIHSSSFNVIVSLRLRLEQEEPNKVLGKLSSFLQSNLLAYAASYDEELAQMISDYFLDCTGDTGRTSERMQSVIVLLMRLINELNMLFPAKKKGIVKKEKIFDRIGGIDKDMEKMLARKSVFYERLANTRTTLLGGLIKSCFLYALRFIRSEPLDRDKAGQIAVDLGYLAQVSYDLVETSEENFLLGLFMETMDSLKASTMESPDFGRMEKAIGVAMAKMKL